MTATPDSNTSTIERTSTVPVSTDAGDHDTFAHYARKADIEDSIFNGTEITALCGKKWRPAKDFTKYPVCGTCKSLYEQMKV